MSSAKCLLSEDQFLCSICLDMFTDPVSTPCGHNFCKRCITQHWDSNPSCVCPNCKEVFKVRPKLRINTFISEMAAQFRQSAQQEAAGSSSSTSDHPVSTVRYIPCDICSETKLMAVKSCTVCLASYCEAHLKPHLTMSGLRRHELMDPTENLEVSMCSKHDKQLELFCKTDQVSICLLCFVSDHKTHDIIPLKEAAGEKNGELEKADAEICEMIKERYAKIDEIRFAQNVSKNSENKEMAEGRQIFRALIQTIDESKDEVVEVIKKRRKLAVKRVEDINRELEEELDALYKRSEKMDELSNTKEDLQPHIQSLTAPPSSRDWPNVIVTLPTYRGTVFRAVVQLDKNLNKQMSTFFKAQHKKVQRYAVDVTFDPSTAKPGLTLSEDGKQVHGCDQETHDSEDRKDNQISSFVLGAQSFSSGRFYYEVDVKEKIEWDLGVAGESVSGERSVTAIPQNKLWTISLRVDEDYRANNDPSVSLILKWLPDKVGVFVDYEERLISFYEVDESAPIYSFTGCRFTGKLRPFFSPGADLGGKNSTPLTITPVRLTEQDSMAGTI
ncbi:E3 ubiquitin-protein ligase TRIM21-like [Archocentrus centrarchus]|uniref:E3 ubiquitin-protein ligase TRIM21-like n=1 Tax=Archocentrus centrarchus TaxID=63155 RepID=UPI0011EA24FF|nr:E3 ubiquitin-protein ligase TRIM21-like [Archocentrus centrarchus]